MDFLIGTLLVLLGLGFFVLTIVLPIVAIVKAGRAREEAASLRGMVDTLRLQLEALQKAPKKPVIEVVTPAAPAAPAEAPAQAPPVAAPPPEPPPAPAPAPDPTPLIIPDPVALPDPVPVAASAPDTIPVPADVVAARMAEAQANAGGPSTPTPTPPPPSEPKKPEATKATFEERIAFFFTRAGAAAVLLGVAYFFKYAVDNNWIGPLGRVAIGVAAGLIALVIAELTRARTKPVWTQTVTGVGLGFLLLSAYASHAFYHLVPVGAAFGAFAIVSLLGGALAVRHKAEAVLIISLAAALSAPVLLSTGEDRPLALFSYLLVVTSLTHAASLHMQFRIALWLAIAGSGVLFLGWHEKFFDAHAAPAHPLEDVPLAQLEGPYLHLASRIVPLGAVTAFLIQWLVVYRIARKNKPKLWPVAVLVAAALLAHVGFAALLYDHPIHLGALLALLGIVSSVMLSREGKSHLLGLPLLASFAVLVTTVHRASREQPLPMLIMLALWGGIYVAGFLRGKLAADSKPSPMTLGLIGGVGLGFAILSAALLAHPHPLGFASVMVGLSLLYGLLGVSVARPSVMAGAIGLSFLFLLSNMPRIGDANLPFIGITGAWAAIYIIAIAWELLVKHQKPTAPRLLVISAAGLAFAFFAQSHTDSDQGHLRAGLLALVGVVDLAIGAALLKSSRPSPSPDGAGKGERAAENRRAATVLLGQALGLFAAAAAVFFTGATVTVVWAVLACVVVWLASGDKDPIWLTGGLVLLGITVLRFLSVDVSAPHLLEREFMNTLGKSGELHPAFLLNQRGIALAGLCISLLVSARSTRRIESALFRHASTVLFTIGHALVLTLLVTEIHTLALTKVVPPTGAVSHDEWGIFITHYAQSLVKQRERLAMITTLVMAGYATTLVIYGFTRQDKLHRYLGLSLFGLTLGKLVTYDLIQLQRVYQILVLVFVGCLLLGAAFLYARFGKRLAAIIRDGKAGPLLVLIAAFAVSSRASAFEPEKLAETRVVNGVSAPGYFRIEVDADLYRHSKSEATLSDLRLAGPDGKEVPYLIRHVPIQVPPVMHAVTVVDPVIMPDKSSRAILDLGAPGLKHSEVRLEIDGDDFFRRTRIEISTDEKTWALSREGSIVFRAHHASYPTSHTTLGYPVSDARYLRITLLPGYDNKPLRIRSAQAYYLVPASLPLRREVPVKLESRQGSEVIFDAGEPGVPLDALELTIGDSAFERRAIVSATNYKTYWPPAGAALLYRMAAASSWGATERTRIELAQTRKRWLRVTFDDGDNAPLAVQAARAEYRVEELLFRADAAGAHTLYVGAADVGAPSYDLAAVLARSGPVTIGEASLGAFAANPRFGKGPTQEPPLSEKYRVPIGIALGAILLALSLWTIRLLRRAKQE
jgi:uncharacterized membrane protein